MKRLYLAMMMKRELEFMDAFGRKVPVDFCGDGVAGVMLVFTSKKAARQMFGNKVELKTLHSPVKEKVGK